MKEKWAMKKKDTKGTVAAENDADAVATVATKNGAAVPVSQQMTMLIIHPYEAQEDNHISLVAGEYIHGVEMGDDGWCSGTTMDGKTGWFPADCVTATEGPASNEAEASPPLLPVLVGAAPNLATSDMQRL